MECKFIETEDDVEENGCSLSEYETHLLIRLSGKLSVEALLKRGFNRAEIATIQNWMHAL